MTSIFAAVGLVAGLSLVVTGVLLRYAKSAPRVPECYDLERSGLGRDVECQECPLVCKHQPAGKE